MLASIEKIVKPISVARNSSRRCLSWKNSRVPWVASPSDDDPRVADDSLERLQVGKAVAGFNRLQPNRSRSHPFCNRRFLLPLRREDNGSDHDEKTDESSTHTSSLPARLAAGSYIHTLVVRSEGCEWFDLSVCPQRQDRIDAAGSSRGHQGCDEHSSEENQARHCEDMWGRWLDAEQLRTNEVRKL